MKKVILLLLIFSAPAFALDKVTVEMCNSMSNLAKKVMTDRQHGVSKGSATLKAINKVEEIKADEHIKNIYLALIEDAYKVPVYNVIENKENMILKFQNEIFSMCLNAYKK
jgi:hypothetical protein